MEIDTPGGAVTLLRTGTIESTFEKTETQKFWSPMVAPKS